MQYTDSALLMETDPVHKIERRGRIHRMIANQTGVIHDPLSSVNRLGRRLTKKALILRENLWERHT